MGPGSLWQLWSLLEPASTSHELCWLLRSLVQRLATSYRAERPFPGRLVKHSVEAKWQLVPAVGFLTLVCSSLPLGLSPSPPGAVQDTALILPHSLKPWHLLGPVHPLG